MSPSLLCCLGEGEEKDRGGNLKSLKECLCVLVITNCILKSITGNFDFTTWLEVEVALSSQLRG